MPHKSKPMFSIVVPAYNVEDYLEQCIESVLKQEGADYELILVDDGSTDRTSEICDRYSIKVEGMPVVRVIHQPNSGLSAARNTGVRESHGKYLLFLDGDDYFEPTALKAIKAGLEPGLDLLRYQAQEVFSDGEVLPHVEFGFATLSGVAAFSKLAAYHYTENAWLYAYRREFFARNGFQYAPGRLAEDFGLTPLVIARADKVKAIPDICYNYRQRSGSIMHDSAQILRRSDDMLAQLKVILPEIAKISDTQPILHYLVVSFLTGATKLDRGCFLQAYQAARKAEMLQYVHAGSLKALPRAILLKHFPKIFYQVYHRSK